MRKLLLLLAVAMFLSTPAFAAFDGPQTAKRGFGGPAANAQAMSVAQVKNMRDNARVTLVGNIESQIGKKKYIFKDASGTITVEISDRIFGNLAVTPNDTVRISGKVDKDWDDPIEIEVNHLELVSGNAR